MFLKAERRHIKMPILYIIFFIHTFTFLTEIAMEVSAIAIVLLCIVFCEAKSTHRISCLETSFVSHQEQKPEQEVARKSLQIPAPFQAKIQNAFATTEEVSEKEVVTKSIPAESRQRVFFKPERIYYFPQGKGTI